MPKKLQIVFDGGREFLVLNNLLRVLHIICKTNLFRQIEPQRSNWSGLMQHVSQGYHPLQSVATLLQIWTLNPFNYSCIYSVLTYMEYQARKLHIQTPCITFEQLIFIKTIGDYSCQKQTLCVQTWWRLYIDQLSWQCQ